MNTAKTEYHNYLNELKQKYGDIHMNEMFELMTIEENIKFDKLIQAYARGIRND